jgi:hypothetical protein
MGGGAMWISIEQSPLEITRAVGNVLSVEQSPLNNMGSGAMWISVEQVH